MNKDLSVNQAKRALYCEYMMAAWEYATVSELVYVVLKEIDRLWRKPTDLTVSLSMLINQETGLAGERRDKLIGLAASIKPRLDAIMDSDPSRLDDLGRLVLAHAKCVKAVEGDRRMLTRTPDDTPEAAWVEYHRTQFNEHLRKTGTEAPLYKGWLLNYYLPKVLTGQTDVTYLKTSSQLPASLTL
jgi:hypothetical protein